ncbi:alpha/beta fold hydrolase [Homoserinimonas sp. A447]
MPEVVSQDGTSISYETVGSGPAVILVDGAMCFRGAGPTRSIAEELAAEFTVYLYDRRGRGASGDTLPFAVEREIEDIGALVAQAGGSAAVFGISSGAALVLRAAASIGPQRLSRIALYEPPYMPEPALSSAEQYTNQLTSLLASGRRADAVELFMRRVGVPEVAIEGMKASPSWAATEALAPTLAYDDAAMGDSRVPVALASQLTVPTLTLAGELSPDFLRYGAEEVAAAVPGARFEIIEGQTHDISAEPLAAHLVKFFAVQV